MGDIYTRFMGKRITKIVATDEKLSSRGGLSLFLKYVENIKIYDVIESAVLPEVDFGAKGLDFAEFLKQMFAFYIDGTDMSISGFDRKKTDSGYAAALENDKDDMAASGQITRMFIKLKELPDAVYNKILAELFISRLKYDNPEIIILGADTMVLDNNYSKQKEQCEPTYKKVNGFQPLHITWGPYIIDMLFRNGKAHSNHGTDFVDRVGAAVKLIRDNFSKTVPIFICADSGFADQKVFEYFDSINIHYIITSRIYADIKDYASKVAPDQFVELHKDKQIWSCLDFGDKRNSWDKYRRAILTTLKCDEQGQYILDLNDNRRDNLIYTNIGTNKIADQLLKEVKGEDSFTTKDIVELSHKRGADELIHRSIKELATKEQLPFKRFGMNRAYYSLLTISHFLFEIYKRDITPTVLSVVSYPNTFRRKLIDFAVKITSSARAVILNVPQTVFDNLQICDLWEKCKSPPVVLRGLQ